MAHCFSRVTFPTPLKSRCRVTENHRDCSCLTDLLRSQPLAKYLISYPRAAMVVPSDEFEAVGRDALAVVDEAKVVGFNCTVRHEEDSASMILPVKMELHNRGCPSEMTA